MRILNQIKKISFVFCFIFTSSLFASPTSPSWFGNLKPTHSYELIGYGEATTLSEAKTNAREDLAKQIKVHIKSELTIDEKSSLDSYSEKIIQSTKENSNITFSELKELQKEEKDRVWYVAYGYENLSATIKLAKKLQGFVCRKTPHIYLSHTPFYEDLALETNASNCVMPTYFNGVNNIGIGEVKVVFDFEKLLSPLSKGLKITTSKNHLKNGESFVLNIQAPKGYVSVFNVFEGGKVNVVVQNLEHKKDENFIFPSPSENFELTAEITIPNATEGYFAISSPKKLDLSLFGVSDFQNQSNGNYRFNELLKLMELYSFGSTTVNIRNEK